MQSSQDSVVDLSASSVQNLEIQKRLMSAKAELDSVLEKFSVRLIGALKFTKYGIVAEVELADSLPQVSPADSAPKK